ncbi:MAG: alpha-amylase/4-alpha-glucanotransferase domain-containing protein [Spirochaetaceae bacterium]
MIKVRLIFGTTNSQPVGGADRDIEAAYQHSYKPFIRALYNAPDVHATLHFSGNLLQWIEHRHSEFIDVLGEMTGRKQVEMLGGGFYDPVFSLIPRGDRLGQLERMTTYLRKRFGRRPRGAWITQGIWDPALPALLKSSGIEYTFLDDIQFNLGGCDETARRYAPCITEDEGKTVEVFPVATAISAALFHEEPQEVVERILAAGDEAEPPVVSVMSEGERPSRQNANGEDRGAWLSRFFELLIAHREEVETIHPGRYVKTNRPHGRGYFTTTPYNHIARWMAPYRSGNGREQSKLPQGSPWTNGSGFFRHVLTQYPESNRLYSKMQYIHVLVNQIRGDKYRKRLAREELWRGQNHNAYWHTPAGGIYTSRLRKSSYASLIEAEKVTREKGIFIPSIITLDFDMDGLSEFLFQGQEMNAYVHSIGGTVFELDYLPKPWNYQDTMTRHREAYHRGSEPADAYPRNSFIDHFIRSEESADRFYRMKHHELGDFVQGVYEPESVHKEDHRLVLHRDGHVKTSGGEIPVHLRKTFTFHGAGLQVAYRIVNKGARPLTARFATELNTALPPVHQATATLVAVGADGVEHELTDEERTLTGTERLLCRDYVHSVAVHLESPGANSIWCLPIETTYLSHGELITEYQATCIVPQWELELAPDEVFEADLSLELRPL